MLTFARTTDKIPQQTTSQFDENTHEPLMQETIARKRAPLLQPSSKWQPATVRSKSSRKHRSTRHARQSEIPPFIDVDITHPHVPTMHDDQRSSNGHRQSTSPYARSGAENDTFAATASSHSESGSELEDYLDQGGDSDDDDQEAGLTQTERRKRRHRQWRDRFGERSDSNTDHSPVTWVSMLRANLINVTLIGLWYTFSISISVYNKWMFSEKNLHFPFPLFTTSAHMLVQFTLSGAILYFVPRFRPHAELQINGNVDDDDRAKEKNSQVMSLKYYLTRIGPCGTATALDIGLGNFSLRFISLAFYTMCKSSVLAFVLMFAFLFRLEKPSWKLGGIIGLMTIGVVMMVAGETAFSAIGFILVMSASFCSGFRWSLTQILLLHNSATSNPFSSIFFLTPVMFVSLIVLAIPIEGPVNLIIGFRNLAAVKGPIVGILIMIFPGTLAFMMVAAEFALLQRTSVVTLSVCGIFKEVLTISTAARTFGDELSPINISGLFVTIAAIAAYNYLKYLKMRQELEIKAKHVRVDEVPEQEADTVYDRNSRYDGESSASQPMLSQAFNSDNHTNGHHHVQQSDRARKLEDLG